MKKQDLLTKLALLGITSAALIGPTMAQADQKVASTKPAKATTADAGQASCSSTKGCGATQTNTTTTSSSTTTTPVATPSAKETQFRTTLDDNGKKTFDAMDAEGKALAMKVFYESAPGKNLCAGLNACSQPGKNACAGKGSCQGQSQKKFTDPNMAVNVVSDHMTLKRQGLTK